MHRKLAAWPAMALAALTLGVAPAGADTRYATPKPSAGADCSQAKPCALAAAIDDAFDGDEVVVGPGTYDLTGGPSLVVDTAIDLHGAAGPPRPQILTDNINTGVRVLDPATVRDLEIHHSGGGGIGLALEPVVGEAVAERVVVKGEGYACSIQNAAIRDSVCQAVHNNTGGSGLIMWGVNPSDDFSATATNVTAIGASTLGTQEYGIYAAAVEETSVLLLGKNVIASGGDADVRVQTSGNSTGSAAAFLINSNFSTVTTAGPGKETPPVPGVTDNQTAEPLLVDPFPIPNGFASDLHQLPGSPTIDAGILGVGVGGFDIDGEPRCMGGAVDIGADELTGTPCGTVDQMQPSPTPAGRKCQGKPATIVAKAGRITKGTKRRDVIAGTNRRDVVNAGGGNDLVCGGGGNDLLLGGPGKDTLLGQGGRDTLRGQGGRDKLIGGPGRDLLRPGSGQPSLSSRK